MSEWRAERTIEHTRVLLLQYATDLLLRCKRLQHSTWVWRIEQQGMQSHECGFSKLGTICETVDLKLIRLDQRCNAGLLLLNASGLEVCIDASGTSKLGASREYQTGQ